MGATNCPETPRQKMITMMYLVYTAMLALNVSAEVVEGFRTVGTAMTKSNINLQEKLDDTYANFQQAYTNSPEKVQEKWEKAQKVQALSARLGQVIDSVEYDLIFKLNKKATIKGDKGEKSVTVNFADEAGNPIHDSIRRVVNTYGIRWMEAGLDNTNDVTPFFLGGKAEGEYAEEGTRADLLKKEIHNYERQVKEILGEDSAAITFGFDIDQKVYSPKKGKTVSWEMLNFNEAVAGAALVTLTRLKGETMNAEFDAVNMLYKQVSKGDMSFDQIAMISRPKSTYIIKGGTFETDFNVAAYDSKQKFTATVNGQQYVSNDSGSVHYRVVCNNEGPQRVTGTAYVKSPDGGTKEYPISESYFVAKPMASISLDNLQVVYAGIENPITASVPGVDSRNIRVTMDPKDGKISQADGDGHYLVTPNGNGKNIFLTVQAIIDGKPQDMGQLKFRVKPIPDPIIKVGTYENGAKKAARKDFTDGTMVVASKSKDFDFKVAPGAIKILELNITVGTKTCAPIKGTGRLDAEVLSTIRKANRGDNLVVSVKVQMPDGKPRDVECVIKLAK